MVHLSKEFEFKSEETQVMVAVCGGDGSLGRLLSELRKEDLLAPRLHEISFCLLPYGTGNDCAQAFGWGNDEGPYADSVLNLATALVNSTEDKLSVWEVTIEGDVYSFQNGKPTLLWEQ